MCTLLQLGSPSSQRNTSGCSAQNLVHLPGGITSHAKKKFLCSSDTCFLLIRTLIKHLDYGIIIWVQPELELILYAGTMSRVKRGKLWYSKFPVSWAVHLQAEVLPMPCMRFFQLKWYKESPDPAGKDLSVSAAWSWRG